MNELEPKPRNNGDSPCYLLIQTNEGNFIFGPYTKTTASFMQEEMGGTLVKEEYGETKPND